MFAREENSLTNSDVLDEYFEKDANDLTNYILLIDEPNIYLHASAQLDLLNNIFKEKLRDIQIIYTTIAHI